MLVFGDEMKCELVHLQEEDLEDEEEGDEEEESEDEDEPSESY